MSGNFIAYFINMCLPLQIAINDNHKEINTFSFTIPLIFIKF